MGLCSLWHQLPHRTGQLLWLLLLHTIKLVPCTTGLLLLLLQPPAVWNCMP
jgi:hypothetical protein